MSRLKLPASRGSNPAMTCRTMAQSSTQRASGPQWSKVYELGRTPPRPTRPKVGIRPDTPHSEAGPRIEPPVSEPSAIGTSPAATAAPEPLEDPPVKRAKSHGLRAGGHRRSKEGPP